MTIYLNASSHGAPSQATLDAMAEMLQVEHEAGTSAALAKGVELKAVTCTTVAQLLGADVEGVSLGNATTPIWTALMARLDLTGKRVLVAPHEWGENIRFLQGLPGVQVEKLPEIDFLAPDLSTWEDMIGPDVAAICVPMVSSVHGHLYPVEQIGALKRPEGCYLIVDGAQAVGQVPIDLSKMGCDAFISTGRKWLRGPRSSAMFWLSEALRSKVPVAQLEPFDFSQILMAGLLAALKDVLEIGQNEVTAKIRATSAGLASELGPIGVALDAGMGPMTGAVTIAIPKDRTACIAEALAGRGFDVKCPNPEMDECVADRPLAQTHLPMRISPHVYTTDEDISAFVSALSELL